MLEAILRDVKVKGKKIRNSGYTTGLLKKKSGEVVYISIPSYKLDTYVSRYGAKDEIELNLIGERVVSKVSVLKRDVLSHNIMNIELLEV
ncbi:hypothetical protein [Clostridium sp.]|uniref:hypothetical protein n=1 Tax=Clostridium sp. TaxID=1506 RepID=UPI003F3B168E